MLFGKYVPATKLDGKVSTFGGKYKNPVNAKDLCPIAFNFWQIMVYNVLPQGGKLNDVSKFGIYVVWMFVNQRMNTYLF